MKEPSVLDYVKAKLMPWRGPAPRVPEPEREEETQSSTAPVSEETPAPALMAGEQAITFPWRATLALLLAIFAQVSLEPHTGRSWGMGVVLYLFAFAFLVWAVLRKEWVIAQPEPAEIQSENFTYHLGSLAIGALLALGAFITFGGNRFNPLNLALWLGSIFFITRAFWIPAKRMGTWAKVRAFFGQRQWGMSISRWGLLLLAVIALVLFFRFYRLNQVPPEMVSDQAEKLLDVYDLLHGQTKIFFERNTGREGLQMYLTAAVISLFNTGYSFLSLKIGTTLAGLFTLMFIYLLGKEIGNRRVGLFALTFAGIAYWANVITRVGLRFTLYPTFVAPTLYFLIRGIRRSSRNDFILAGFFLGLGLHGYSPFRIMPVVVLVAVGLYLLHRQSAGQRRQVAWNLVILILVAIVIFLPLMRYWYDEPSMFNYRALTRVGSIEQPLPGPAGLIFMNNLGRAMAMFGWDNGEVWPISVTHRPALDIVAAALFYLGLVLVLVRYVRQRHWLDLFWILSIPILMLPSILSLAFPAENPILNRTAGAIIPVFIIVGLALDGYMASIETGLGAPWGARLAWGIGILLLVWSSFQNYDLVFRQYQRNYELSAWNTSEMGKVIRDFSETVGDPETAWVVGYPYWVDTRLVGINAGFPTRDTFISNNEIKYTLQDPRPKLFLIKPDDQYTIETLQRLYPDGSLKEYVSRVPTKDFLIFFVPPTKTEDLDAANNPKEDIFPAN